MSNLQQALVEVGYQPTTTQRQVRRRNIEYFNFPEPKPIEVTPSRPRKIQFQRAGDFVRARYEGRKTFVFARNERDAKSRLKSFDGVPNEQRTVTGK